MAKKNNSKGIMQWVEDNKYVILAVLICGTIVSYLVSNYYLERLYYKYPQVTTITKYVKSGNMQVSGASSITMLPSGQLQFTGTGLTLTDKYMINSTSYEKSTPILPKRFTVSAYWLVEFPPLATPSMISCQYQILSPIVVGASYEFKQGKGHIGMGLQF